ncbi:MAG: LytR C-terminal domain-containing protein [bacterium]|nr:LytR C-terminal domain-containing protein [bacterium]
MPKRFYLKTDFSTSKPVRRNLRWTYWVYWLILGGGVVWALSAIDFTSSPQSGVSLKRQSLGSTETSTKLAPVVEIELEEPVVISTVRDTTTVVPPETVEVLKAEVITEERQPSENAAVKMPTVTLFNGCGVKGIGARAKAALERMGFQVVEVRNARNYDYKKSEVLDRRENLELGKLLADSLGIPKQLAAWDTTRSDRDADVSLIVGSDFKKLRWKI